MITKNFHKNFASSLTRASGLRCMDGYAPNWRFCFNVNGGVICRICNTDSILVYNLEIFEKIDPYDPDEDIQTTCRSIHAWISDISHALVFQLI